MSRRLRWQDPCDRVGKLTFRLCVVSETWAGRTDAVDPRRRSPRPSRFEANLNPDRGHSQCGGFEVPKISERALIGTSNPKPHWNCRLASVLSIPKFASESAAAYGELRIGTLVRSRPNRTSLWNGSCSEDERKTRALVERGRGLGHRPINRIPESMED